MECINNFKKRMSYEGMDYRKKRLEKARRTFERTLDIDMSALDLKVTDVNEVNITDSTKTIRCIVNDISNNDQKAFDEKWLLVRNEDNVDIGCYVLFDNAYWLINFKEAKSVSSHRKFVMKKCNQIIKYKHRGIVYDIPVVVRNLTQYSDGLQDIVYTSVPDNKLSISYGINYVTKDIKLGHRVMVGKEKVYRTTLIEDYQYNVSYDKEDGLGSAIVVFTALGHEDDLENNLADNNESDIIADLHIIGSDNTTPGGRYKYKLSENIYTKWEIEYLGNKNEYVDIKRSGDDCVLCVNSDMGLLGESFKLISLNNANIEQVSKNITITGF